MNKKETKNNKKKDKISLNIKENQSNNKSFFKKVTDFINIKKNPAFVLILSGFFLNLFGIVLLYYFIKPSDTGVILHYNSFLGIDVIAFDLNNYYQQVYYASGGGMTILIVNSVLSILINFQNKNKKESRNERFEKTRKVSSLFLLVGSILVQLVVLVYILAIIKVNS